MTAKTMRRQRADRESPRGCGTSSETAPDRTHAWFWTERWQRMERESDADIAAGRERLFDDVDALFRNLDGRETE